MARPAEFNIVETQKGWCLSVPQSMAGDGKRRRKFYRTKTAATDAAAKLKAAHREGQRGSVLSATVAVQAAEALRILEPCGLSLIEAARIAAAQAGRSANLETFGERWQRTMLHGEMVWSPVYARDMANVPRWVGPEVMASRCGALNREVMKAAVETHRSKNPGTVKMTMLRVMAVLGDRERDTGKRAEVSILTVPQCARLLRVCERVEERRVVALLLFAGIRPDVEHGEIGRLQWDAVGADQIYVSSDVCKTNQDRHIPISSRLRRLIRGHPTSGRVVPNGWKKAWQRIRRDAGIAHLQDVCRHTFASHALAAWGEGEAKQAMGHTAGSTTLFRHYRRAVTKDAGEKYFR